MKAIRFILPLAIVFGLSQTTLAQSTKMGLVDQQAIVLDMPEYASAQKKFSEREASKMKEIETLYLQYQTKMQEYETVMMSGSASSAEQQALETEIMGLQERIQRAEEMAQMYLADYNTDLMEPINEKLNAAIKAVAKANGYTHVTDLTLFYVYPESDDITGKVKAHLGL